VRRAQQLLFHPGISVVREARLAVRYGEVHAMHDPTEGGLLSGLYELAQAGCVGLRVWKARVPVLKETRAFSQVLRFDPFALIASGALLVVVSARTAGKVSLCATRHLCSHRGGGSPRTGRRPTAGGGSGKGTPASRSGPR
jgi:hydrogenase maturation factor